MDGKTLVAPHRRKFGPGRGRGATSRPGPEHLADLMLQTYNQPPHALVKEICITPTPRKY